MWLISMWNVGINLHTMRVFDKEVEGVSGQQTLTTYDLGIWHFDSSVAHMTIIYAQIGHY